MKSIQIDHEMKKGVLTEHLYGGQVYMATK